MKYFFMSTGHAKYEIEKVLQIINDKLFWATST